MVDNVLAQAYAVNEGFGAQREMLQGVQRRIGQAAGKVPGINGLIGRIGAKRRRDGVIMVSCAPHGVDFYLAFGCNLLDLKACFWERTCVQIASRRLSPERNSIERVHADIEIYVGRFHSVLFSGVGLVHVSCVQTVAKLMHGVEF